MKIELEFYECETDGDLNWYSEAIEESGGSIIDRRVDHNNELGYVTVSVTDKEEFLIKLLNTDQGGYLN
jgi:hypothetical protein